MAKRCRSCCSAPPTCGNITVTARNCAGATQTTGVTYSIYDSLGNLISTGSSATLHGNATGTFTVTAVKSGFLAGSATVNVTNCASNYAVVITMPSSTFVPAWSSRVCDGVINCNAGACPSFNALFPDGCGLDGATVSATGPESYSGSTTTDVHGLYTLSTQAFTAYPVTINVTVSKAGYSSQTFTVTSNGCTTPQPNSVMLYP